METVVTGVLAIFAVLVSVAVAMLAGSYILDALDPDRVHQRAIKESEKEWKAGAAERRYIRAIEKEHRESNRQYEKDHPEDAEELAEWRDYLQGR